MSNLNYIAVTGAVGAGATTLSNLIAQNWDVGTLLEGEIEVINPFFEDAQQHPERWAFSSQAHFLAASAKRHRELKELLIRSPERLIIEDRTPYEHMGVYSETARSLGFVSSREFALLSDLASLIEETYVVPDLLIYREMTEGQLVERVATRGRVGESVDFERLRTIFDGFEQFVAAWTRSPVIRVGADLDLFQPEGQARAIAELSVHLGPARH